MNLLCWYEYKCAEKEENVSDSGNKDNVGCDNSAEKVESVEAEMVNVVNIDLYEEGKTDMSESKDENKIIAEDLEHVEGEELFGEPKLEDENRLAVDYYQNPANVNYAIGTCIRDCHHYEISVEKNESKELAKCLNSDENDDLNKQNNLKWDLKSAEEYKLKGQNKPGVCCDKSVSSPKYRKNLVEWHLEPADFRKTSSGGRAENDGIDSGVTEYKKKDHRNGKGKMRISEMIKNNEKSLKKRKKYRMGEHIPEI
ncbi:14663_t:CDS:2 [Dentiscutata erythropus]|uniref:14663_t:CDS:1 n=1 Tax=Dentiscutata erythropus TaxID=1348616 RepID=A0A9N8VF31_9GLOM|nr:14663_t:CDS:2 [Dentiscutata erythropus]